MIRLGDLVVFVLLDVLLVWAAGYALAWEDWIAGQRRRFEHWAYVDASAVREGREEADLFWDTAQPWAPFRRGAGWRYRGERGMALAGVKGRRVEFKVEDGVIGPLEYGVPLLDGRPLGRVNFAATVARTKLADLWGCPICSGFWGAAPLAWLLSARAGFEFALLVVGVLHVAAWGLARTVGWRNPPH